MGLSGNYYLSPQSDPQEVANLADWWLSGARPIENGQWVNMFAFSAVGRIRIGGDAAQNLECLLVVKLPR